MKKLLAAATAALLVNMTGMAVAETIIELGGPATGYLAISNFKTSGTQNGIEGKDSMGNPDPSHNGLPDYANYRMADGRYSAIIASPQSTSSDYSAFANFASGTFNGAPISINNQNITDSNFSTMSAGQISFDSSLITGSGIENVDVGALTFNFDTYNWDGTTNGDGGPYTVGGVPSNPFPISPFSTVYSEHNDGSGAGNASTIYNVSLSNVTGTGLTFEDGILTSMDLDGDLSVLMRIGNIPFQDPPNAFTSTTFTGDFTASGLNYAFNVEQTQSVAIFSGINMVFNRSGIASVSAVPEPSSLVSLGLIFGVVGLRRHRRKAPMN
ncbi:PEP-CTERM sorting domain-containing protein [Roseiconus lacunae]|uniref:PEP-CTERM sorting domain-containing protein n=1 Tax=Roseiconus lacunae TaxID=2605694 RepID=A0ABT7PRD7_9BACT|nr:PEP-CTERM sorting domain-containing protein [Roseiconus lacunae]MDM4019041.1 PEP-CTERM sorting domain-containing protein [Roseiconus lacunae]